MKKGDRQVLEMEKISDEIRSLARKPIKTKSPPTSATSQRGSHHKVTQRDIRTQSSQRVQYQNAQNSWQTTYAMNEEEYHRPVNHRQENNVKGLDEGYEFDEDEETEIDEDVEVNSTPPQPTKATRYVSLKKKSSPQPAAQFQAKTPPKSTTSQKNVTHILCTILVTLCAIAAAIFGSQYLSASLLKNSQQPPLPSVDTIIQNLQNEFGEQPLMTYKIVCSALRRVMEPNPAEPAIIMFLAEKGADEIASRFARKIANAVSISPDDIVVVSGHSYQHMEADVAKKELDVLLSDNLREDRLASVLVERLDVISPEVAIIFHTYCDHENAPFKRAVYLMTLLSSRSDLESLESKDWDTIVQDHLNKVWHKGGNDQVSSLLSRLTVSVAAIVSQR